MKCVWLVPRYGWQDGQNGPARYIDDGCGWAEAHPEVMAGLPEWIAAEMMAASGWRAHHCDTCSKREPTVADQEGEG